jgi:sugar phosphate isomerase/epimerase
MQANDLPVVAQAVSPAGSRGPGSHMAMTRREILAGIAAAGLAAAQQQPPATTPSTGAPDGPRVPRPRTPPKPRTTPVVCLYSQHLIKVEYEAVGMVLRELGFDGCDLAVVPGSHIPPERAGSDLMRGIEAISGVGLEVPIISTSVTSANDPDGRQILGIAGFMGIPLVRPGYWKYGHTPNREVRLAEVQREILGLASIARAYNIATALHNSSGDCVGAGLSDFNGILRNIDPRWVGYDFDPGFATETAGVEAFVGLMGLAMPKLKAVTVCDVTWNKDKPDARKACPLGEGLVDWRQFFTALARARFVGPITIQVRYETKNELNAFRHDLEFVRKQVAAAYGTA